MRLPPREKHLSIGLAAFMGAWALYALFVKPALARLETLQRVVPEKSAVLQELKSKNKECLAMRDKFGKLKNQIASQSNDFALLPFLENLTDQLHLADNVKSITHQSNPLDATYTELTVILKLEDITYNRLVTFLVRIDSVKAFLRIKILDLRKNHTSNGLYNSTIHISNLILNQH